MLRRRLGGKQIRMVYGKGGGSHATLTRAVPSAERQKFLHLRRGGAEPRGHGRADRGALFETVPGTAMPMDIEWAKDGSDGKLYIIQARPETVASQRSPDVFETYNLNGQRNRPRYWPRGRRKDRLRAHPSHCDSARPRGLQAWRDTSRAGHQSGLGAGHEDRCRRSSPTRAAEPVMRRSWRANWAFPRWWAATHATEKLKSGTNVTISCAEGDIGSVYQGTVAFDVTRTPVSDLRRPRTAIMVNVGTPEMAFRVAMQPQAGVGLARMEFIISEHIGVHPMALAQAGEDHLGQGQGGDRAPGRRLQKPSDFFIERLAEGVGTIAAAFYPKPVIVRLSDFKTNEYASLLGGEAFEPKEENPMLGIPRGLPLQPPRLRRGICTGVCGASPGARGNGPLQFAHHGALLPNCRGRAARDRDDGGQRAQAR